MDRLQLAVLVQWAGEQGLQGRKRLQKVVYFLKAAGMPIAAEYTLHHYGPYSRDVAGVCDELVADGLIAERAGHSFSYTLVDATRSLLEQQRAANPNRFECLDAFRDSARALIGCDLWELELGSTIHYFHARQNDWGAALREACAFKGASETDPASIRALELAQSFAN